MPDAFVVGPVEVHGVWGQEGTPVRRRGTLVLESDRVVVREDHHGGLVTPYVVLTDATWSRGELGLHWARGFAQVRGDVGLARAWAQIVETACVLPEVARGLRALGTKRGGTAELQRRFFGPLLVGRRRLEEPGTIEWRLTHFDGLDVRRRIDEVLAAIARERFPARPPHRRALEAELDEATEALRDQLELLDRAAEATRLSAEGVRFVAWRSWTSQLRSVFVEADRSWLRILSVLDSV